MWAVPFDLPTLAMTGPPSRAVEGVMNTSNTGSAQFSVSDTGMLIYLPRVGPAVTKRGMVWVDSTGATAPMRTEETDWASPRFSPDGDRIAFSVSDGAQHDVWVYEWAEKNRPERSTRLTLSSADDTYPVWTPRDFKGQPRIVFASDRGTKGVNNLYWQRADGTGDVQRLTESSNNQRPFSFNPSGEYLAFEEDTPTKGTDLMYLKIEGAEAADWKFGTPAEFLSTPQSETSPMFSPDGRWIAYKSNVFEKFEAYVRPFPPRPGQPCLVSGVREIAVAPEWSPKRPGSPGELFFVSLVTNQMMMASYTVQGEQFRAEIARQWSSGTHRWSSPHALHPDGKRFVIVTPREAVVEKHDKVMVWSNFFDELRRVAPPAKK
jgi:Tol biopolymer transport system component